MKTLRFAALVFVLPLLLGAQSIEWRLDRFNQSGKIRSIDNRYEIHKLNPQAGTLHVDYADKENLSKTRLKATLDAMDKPTRENYLKTIPEGGYLTLFIPRPVIKAPETRWFIYEVFDADETSLGKGRGSAALDVTDGAGPGKSDWIAVQTISLPQKVQTKLTVEVTGETCGETQHFVITRLK